MNADTRSVAARLINAGSENCLPVGTRVSDFEITGVLGEGGFGIVYVAYDHALQRTVAIKEYMPGALAMRAGDDSIALRSERHQETFRLGLKSFINEARILAQFDHPALIKVYRFWEQNNTAYTAMKFYAGRTVKDIVANSPELVDEAWCLRVAGQILGALEMLYTMRILHRDISPDNIIVQENGDAVLLDFGSARQIIGDATRGLTVILKPGYAPVEQYAGDASLEQGPYTDLYALSAVMYFAITGAPPPSSIARMINDPIVPLLSLAPAGYGSALPAAIDKGLAVMAQDRPQTIAAFRGLLGIDAPDALHANTASPAPASSAAPAEPRALTPVRDVALPAAAGALPVAPPPAQDMPVAASRSGQPKAARALAGRLSALPLKQRRLLAGAGAASLLAIGTAGLYALVETSSRNTFQSVEQQPRPAPPSAPAAGAAAETASQSAPGTASPSAAGVARPTLLAEGTGGDAPAEPLPSALTVVEIAAGMASSPPDASENPASKPLVDVPAAPKPTVQEGASANEATPKPEVKRETGPASARYKVRIKPWGTLYVDGKSRGVSPPLKQLVLTPGKHTIRIVNPSFPEHVRTIQVDRNKGGMIVHDFSVK